MSCEPDKAPGQYDWELYNSGDRAIIGTGLNTYLQQRLLEARFTLPGQQILKDRDSYLRACAELEDRHGVERGEWEMYRLIKARANGQLKAKVFVAALANYLNDPSQVETEVPASIQSYRVHEAYVYESSNKNVAVPYGTINISRQVNYPAPFAVLVFNGDGFERRLKKVRPFITAAIAALLHAEPRIDLKIPVPPPGGNAHRPGPT